MRFVEMDGNRVRFVLQAELSDDYKILPPNSVEIPLNSTAKQGDIYENGSFRKPTAEEISDSQPKEQVKFTYPLTDMQRDGILIELAYRYGIEPEEVS